MGKLVDGKWTTQWYSPDAKGHFVRKETSFRDRICDEPGARFRPEAGRYHLVVSHACPWAHRTMIVRKLRGLEQAVSVSVVDPLMLDEGWVFEEAPSAAFDVHALHEVYTLAVPDYTGRVTVPLLWDRERATIVNNESREIIEMFNDAMRGLGDPGVDVFPEHLRDDINETIDAIYHPINNGVYRAGFASSQAAYDQAVVELFKALDHWDEVLEKRRYLCGEVITAADWCLFTTLLRFDPVYHVHFKCSHKRIADYKNLSGYLRELYQVPGVAQTCHLDHVRRHYFCSHASINPRRIVAVAPAFDLKAPHGRA